MHKALHGGPWFILNHFLSVRKWVPKFIASATHLTYSALWVRLPELPTEFYDLEILQCFCSKLGQLLKVDTCTSATIKGRYARICIEVPLEKSLKTHVYIGNHKQIVLYEGLNLLCTKCERFGHATWNCYYTNTFNTPTTSTSMSATSRQQHSDHPKMEEEWKIVIFPKKPTTRNKNNIVGQ